MSEKLRIEIERVVLSVAKGYAFFTEETIPPSVKKYLTEENLLNAPNEPLDLHRMTKAICEIRDIHKVLMTSNKNTPSTDESKKVFDDICSEIMDILSTFVIIVKKIAECSIIAQESSNPIIKLSKIG